MCRTRETINFARLLHWPLIPGKYKVLKNGTAMNQTQDSYHEPTSADIFRTMTGGRPFVFVIMSDWSPKDKIFYTIKKVVEEKHNLGCIRADMIHAAGHDLLAKTQLLIERAELIIADTTDLNPDKFSPNVYYEIGYAASTGRHPLLVIESGITVPSFLQELDVIKYEPTVGGLNTFEKVLTDHLRIRLNPMEPPEPSQSNTDYIFISYKREELAEIVSILNQIVSWGNDIWYDRGIPGGAEWPTLIEERVSKCKVLLVFLSQAAVESKWVQREIKFADSENRPIIGIRLDKNLELRHGLKVVMTPHQMLDVSNPKFADELRKALNYVTLQ